MEHNRKGISRTIYAIKNVIFNFGYQIINTIANIIVPPLIISKYGSIVNGLISTIKQIVNYIQVVGAGISESTVVSLYKPLEEQDDKKISAIYKASEKTFNRSGAIFSIISVLIAFVYPFFIQEELDYGFIVKIILILCIAGASEFFAIGKYRTLLIADQKMYIVNLAQIIGAIVSTTLTIILIKLSCSILIVQLVSAIIYACRVCILYLYIHQNYKYIDKSVSPDYEAISKRKAAMVHQIASLIIFGSQTLFVANFCGLAEASVYSVYNLIFSGINTILSTVSSGMLAGMGNLIASSDDEKVKRVYSIYEFGYYILVFTVYITTAIMIQSFIKIYTNGITDVNYIRPELIILFTIKGLLNCLRTPGATMINAKGHYNETKNRAIIEMTICLIGQTLLVGKLGIVGVLLGTIIAYLYRTIDVIIYSNKVILNQNLGKSFIRIGYNLLILIVLMIIGFKFIINAESYLTWIIYACIIALSSFTIMIAINAIMDRKTMKSGKEYITNIFKREK